MKSYTINKAAIAASSLLLGSMVVGGVMMSKGSTTEQQAVGTSLLLFGFIFSLCSLGTPIWECCSPRVPAPPVSSLFEVSATIPNDNFNNPSEGDRLLP